MHGIGVHATYRAALAGDDGVLRAMLYEAFAWRPGVVRPPPAEALAHPEISRYVDGRPRDGDAGVIAERAGAAIGAAWYRRFDEAARGYGFVAAEIPELTIGVAAEARGRGVGTAWTMLLDLSGG
jgi:GNAT superfamily N-acetyltransferase